MDRAAKVKKYRKELHGKQNVGGQAAFGRTGAGLPPGGILAACLASAALLAALLFLLYKKNDASALAYVPQEEFISLLSFLAEDALPVEWGNDLQDAVTKGQLKEAVQAVGLSGAIPVEGGNSKAKREDLMACYEQILDYLDLEGAVTKKTVLVLWQGSGACRTQDGELKLNVDSLKLEALHTYEAYLMGKTLIGVRGESNKTIALRDATVDSAADGRVDFTYQKQEYKADYPDTGSLKEQAAYTLCIKGGKITKIKGKDGASGSTGSGQQEKKAVQKLPDTVKVLLLNKGAVHYSEVYLSCDSQFKVEFGKKTSNYKSSEIVDVKKLKLKQGGCAQVAPLKSSAKLFLADKKGSPVSNGYFGSFFVYKDAQGYYIVNKVSIEKYLYSVVASEMPASFGKEALKAQAVCARSYVYRQIAAGDYGGYHAQIDDSTNYQVYNKSQISDIDVEAVEETAGQVMYAQDEIVNAYYYSASCGYGSGMEIWNQTEDTCPYLKAKTLDPSKKSNAKFDMSDEKTFRAFITSKKEKSYDSNSRYFRWQAKVELGSHTGQLKEAIEKRTQISPQNFTFYSTKAKKPKKVASMKGFGGANKMYCSKRSKSGAILTLTIAFDFGKVEIRSEYNIRAIVGCALEQVAYADNSTDTASRFLPSAYFSISYDKKGKRFLLAGGGNGHGIGMSQYGADSMAQAGWDYKKILNYYYDGITVRKF